MKIKKKITNFYINADDNVDLILTSIEYIFFLNIKKISIYIHNLDFDGSLILESLSKTEKKYNYNCFIRESSLYSLEIKDILSSNVIVFICSYKIFPLSLKKIAKDFTIYQKKPFPYLFAKKENLNYVGAVPGKEYWNSFDDYAEYISTNDTLFDFKKYSIEYCNNDVLITSSFVKKIEFILLEFDIKIINVFSGPSLALKIFIKKFNKNKISFSNSELFDRVCRTAYYGGRCEVYGNPNKDDHIFHYDFTGMYAQCMLQNFAYGKYSINTHNLKIKNPGFYWIIFSSNMEFPVLPIHDKITNKLLFVNGENLEGCYWFEEIILHLKMGGEIKKILYSIEFTNYSNVFSEYSTFFSEIRKRGGAYSAFGKNMNNFLYGRLGITDSNEYSFFINKKELKNIIEWKNWKILSIKEINNIVMLTVEIDENVMRYFNLVKKKFKKNVSISAMITSKARIKLYSAQQDVIKNKGKLLYSDTDSVFASFLTDVINQQHGEIYWDGNKKDTKIKDAVFASPKTYALLYHDDTQNIKIKGFRAKEIDFFDFKKKYYDEESIYQKINIIEKSNFSLKYEEIVKLLNLNFYDKRNFSIDKKSTSPIKLN